MYQLCKASTVPWLLRHIKEIVDCEAALWCDERVTSITSRSLRNNKSFLQVQMLLTLPANGELVRDCY